MTRVFPAAGGLFGMAMLVLVPMTRTLAQEGSADLVVLQANVITMSDKIPRAENFAVKDGRFIAVGSPGSGDGMQRWIGPKTRVLRLEGRTIVPGFIDAHCHPGAVYPEDSPWATVDCRPAAVKNMDGLIATLRRKAEKTPEGEWIVGARYQTLKLGREPTAADLDKASTKHPIIIGHASGHQSACNTLALQLAKVTAATKDPAGGKFLRDANGAPNGVLQEGAASVVRGAIADRPQAPPEVALEAYREGFRRYLARGVTSAGVAGASSAFARTLERARTDDLPLRLNILLNSGAIKDAEQRMAEGKLGDENVRYGGVKLFHGGSVSAHTCWISFPYADRPDYYGLKPARSQEDLDALILRVHKAGLQVCIHTNGDRELEMVINAFEKALKESPRENHRHRLEHCAVVTDELLRRVKALGLVIVPHSYIWELGDTVEAFGESHWNQIHALRSMLDAGIPIAAHSDSPVSSADPLTHIQGLVTRRDVGGKVYGAEQKLTVEQALRAWTLGGAYASFEDSIKGSIEVDKLADFVVLADDITKVEAEKIREVKVLGTYVGGKRVLGEE
jgi:predicted amidohydrolase YtcJ